MLKTTSKRRRTQKEIKEEIKDDAFGVKDVVEPEVVVIDLEDDDPDGEAGESDVGKADEDPSMGMPLLMILMMQLPRMTCHILMRLQLQQSQHFHKISGFCWTFYQQCSCCWTKSAVHCSI